MGKSGLKRLPPQFVGLDLTSKRVQPPTYGKMDLGIVKYHFELGAGKENFTWK